MRARALLILTVIVALVLTVAGTPALAGKPDCRTLPPDHRNYCGDPPGSTTTTSPPPAEVCVFQDRVLQGWDGTSMYRCRWTVTDRSQAFDFELHTVSPEAKTVLGPHLVVADVYQSMHDICFNEYGYGGWIDLPYSWASFTLPPDGNCTGDSNMPDTDTGDVFELTISVQKVKKGQVQLLWTD